MAQVKLAIVYYSTYGTNHQMAEAAAEAAREAGAEVRLRKVRETAPAGGGEGAGCLGGAGGAHRAHRRGHPGGPGLGGRVPLQRPTRYGGAASQMRSFIDTLGPVWQEGKLADKIVSAMTSAQNPHGGQETTLQTLYITFMHWGAILVPPGYTDPAVFAAGGNPYGASVTAAGEGLSEETLNAIRHQARRLVETTGKFVR